MKPFAIRTSIHTSLLDQTIGMLIVAVDRKFGIKAGIEVEMIHSEVTEIIIRFVSTKRKSNEVYAYIERNWTFQSPLTLTNEMEESHYEFSR